MATNQQIIDRLTEVKIRFRHYRTNLGAKVKTKVGISSMNKLCNQSLNTIISISALLAEDQPIYATILQGIFIPPLFPLQDNISVIKGLVSNKLQSILAALTVGIDTIGQESVLSDLYRQLIENDFVKLQILITNINTLYTYYFVYFMSASSSNCDENKTVRIKLNDDDLRLDDDNEEDSIPGPKPPKTPKKEYIEILLNPPEERVKKKNVSERIFSRLQNREVFGNSLSMPNIFELNQFSSVHQRDLKAHTGCVNAVDFSPNEEWIVSGGDDLKVRLWKTVDCCTSENPASSSITMKSMHQSNIFALRFSHKTERVYSAGNDHRLLVHDIRTLGRLCTYRAASSIYYISTHPVDDNMIAASSDDRNVYLFDLRGGEGDGMCTKLKQEGRAYSVCWNPLNHHIVSVCNEKTGLVIYDLRMGINNYVEAGKITRRAICSDWSPNGEALFCVMSRSNPVVFNLSTSEYVHLRDPNYSNFCTIKSCAFAGHNFMCTGSDDWNIYVWKMPTDWSDKNEENENSNAFTVLRGHRSIVNHVKYGSQSGLMLSCGVEKIVKCWSPLPLYGSFSNPKLRTKLSNARLFPYLEMGDPHGDSDIEEDLSTLQRFDYYYEIQSLRMRQSNGMVEDSDSDSDMDSNYSSGFLLYQNNTNNENGDDQESYFSGISVGGDVEDSSTSEDAASLSSQPFGHSVGGEGGHNNFDDAF